MRGNWFCEVCGWENHERNAQCGKCLHKRPLTRGADKQPSPVNPLPDVPESVGRDEFDDAIQAFAHRVADLPPTSYAILRDVFDNVRWALQELDRRTKAHGPTQPVASDPPNRAQLVHLLAQDISEWAHKDEELHPAIMALNEAFRTDEWFEDHDSEQLARLILTVIESAEVKHFLYAPSTSVEGQSVNIPPATEGTAEAALEWEKNLLYQASLLRDMGYEQIATHVRGCADFLRALKLEATPAAVPVEELEALVKEWGILAENDVPLDRPWNLNECMSDVRELIQKHKGTS